MRAVGRLLRVSLAPSAAADVVAGLLFAHGGTAPADARAWWLVPASLGVYHGALALNDWRDREHDRRTRPDRPIPSGKVAPAAALVLGLVLVAAGIACAYQARPESAVWMAGVAALALLYDFAGRGPWSGPLLLAACRAGNLGSGVFWVARTQALEHDVALWLPCVAYGIYVLVVSRLGRMEDAEDAAPLGSRPSFLLVLAALCFFLPLLTPPVLVAERAAPFLLALVAAGGLVHAARRTRPWTQALVERAMGASLRRLLVFAAIIALLRADRGVPDAWIAALAILAGYALSHALRRAFPPS